MKKLYEKNEVMFAVLWICLYCFLSIPVRGNFGDESIWMLLVLSAIAVGITVFVKTNDLEGKYGLKSWPKNGRKYLYFIPMWIAATGNVWGGFELSFNGIHQVFAVLSMLLIGYIEEMIFRGFLFTAMIPKDGIKVSVIVSAVTFGIGHIVNLLAGQASLETVMQVFFAIAWGFIFTAVFYKSGSILPCVLAHGMVNSLAEFGKDSNVLGWVYVGATIMIALLYCPYLFKLPAEKD